MNPRIAFASILLLCAAAATAASPSASLGLLVDSASAPAAGTLSTFTARKLFGGMSIGSLNPKSAAAKVCV